METKEQRQERRDATCRHYAGCQTYRCAAGVDLLKWNDGKTTAFIPTLPCWGGRGIMGENSNTCDQYSPLTKEEQAEEQKRTDAAFARIGRIRKAIIATGERSGVMTCPECKNGTVQFSVASLNGHVHARCSTPGCASWME